MQFVPGSGTNALAFKIFAPEAHSPITQNKGHAKFWGFTVLWIRKYCAHVLLWSSFISLLIMWLLHCWMNKTSIKVTQVWWLTIHAQYGVWSKMHFSQCFWCRCIITMWKWTKSMCTRVSILVCVKTAWRIHFVLPVLTIG